MRIRPPRLSKPKKVLYKCVGGPWDGETIPLVPSMNGDTATMTVRVKSRRGRYVFDDEQTIKWVEE